MLDASEADGFISNPEDEDIAYNIACCFSLLRDVNQGLFWLQKSIEWGLSEGNPDADTDLSFIKRKASTQFAALITQFKDPSKSEQARILPAVDNSSAAPRAAARPVRASRGGGRANALVGAEVCERQ